MRLFEFMQNRWSVPEQQEIFVNGLSKNSTGILKWAIMPDICVIIDKLSAMLEIKELFEWYHFGWMTRKQGYYGQLLTQEFYSAYAVTILKSFMGRRLGRKRRPW